MHGTDEFNDIAGCVENRMTYGMDVFHRTVWQNDSAIQFVARPLADCSLEDFGGLGSIVRMNPLAKCFE